MWCGKNDRGEYHHGDLREALIAYALGRVRSEGVEAFSLREAARAAGVSSGAAYRHFAEKDGLLVAVAQQGFKILAEKTAKATTGTAGPERLRAIGRAYITFASDDPNLFRLMFSQMCMGAAKAVAPGDLAVPSALNQLRAALAEVTGTDSAGVDESLLAVAWSTAHGAASLICDGVWSRDDPKAHAAVDEVVRMAQSKAKAASKG
jgi:AcrR family transcriptional regulator